jgi:hypothetical protein
MAVRKVPHPSTRQLWLLSMERHQQLHGRNAPDAPLGRVLDFDSSQLRRWKLGLMNLDRARDLLTLAVALEVDVMLLFRVAVGALDAKRAVKEMGRRKTKGKARRL